MAPLALADELDFERASAGVAFDCDDATLPRGADNLVVRAANRFFEMAGMQAGVRIALRKRVPHGAGLGGGSSDAATTLLALNQIFDDALPEKTLHTIAAEIGSDVPFFLLRSAALCTGRGEIVTSAPAPPPFRLLLAKPEFGVPTPDAYSRWKTARALPRIDYAPQEFGGATFVNDLELPVFEKYPFLARLKTWFREQAEVGAALLSGSGSTVFAVLRDGAEADDLAARARAQLDPKLWTAATAIAG